MLLNRILRGAQPVSRFHTAKGKRVLLSEIKNLPHAIYSIFQFKFRKQGRCPWINYPSQKALARLLNSNARVLEFGSGFSTNWLAQRAAKVVSVESDRSWYEKVRSELDRPNVELIFFDGGNWDELDSKLEGLFDLIYVDNGPPDYSRYLSAKLGLRKVCPGGVVYLDNSDLELHQEAAKLIQSVQGAKCSFLHGLTPYGFHTSEGLFAYLPQTEPSLRKLG